MSLRNTFRIAVMVVGFVVVPPRMLREKSLRRDFFDAVDNWLTAPPILIPYKAGHIKWDEPRQRPNESEDAYTQRIFGRFRDAAGRLHTKDGRLSLYDKDNLADFYKDAEIFYNVWTGEYREELWQKYSYH